MQQGFATRAAGIAGSFGIFLWAKATRRPVDSFAILAAVAISLTIVINAVFFQSGAHPAPLVLNPVPRQPLAAEIRPKLAEPAAPAATHSIDATRPLQATAVSRNDPIAELIGMSSRFMAVQRVLSDYGYGQLKPTGTLDQPTSAAIEKFEREHNLPVTGRLSDRLLNDLAAMIGHPL